MISLTDNSHLSPPSPPLESWLAVLQTWASSLDSKYTLPLTSRAESGLSRGEQEELSLLAPEALGYCTPDLVLEEEKAFSILSPWHIANGVGASCCQLT